MRRYGDKVKASRKWKKISQMSEKELTNFKEHLEEHNQVNSKVYSHVLGALD